LIQNAEKNKMIKIFTTGACGFVGSNFIQDTPDFEHFQVDLLTKKLDSYSFHDADCVLHLAALVHQMKGAPQEEYFRINSDLAYETALKAKNEGVKHFILMSTIKVYGESTFEIAWNEESECNPQDDYGKSKLEAEKRISELSDNDFVVSIIRSPMIYGKNVKGNMLSLVKLIEKFPALPFKNIENKRSIVYIKNLTALFKQLILNPQTGIFLASDAKPISTSYLVEKISKRLKEKTRFFFINKFFLFFFKKIFPQKMERLWGNLEIDASKSFSKLNFTPPHTTEEGINDMLDWYLTQKK